MQKKGIQIHTNKFQNDESMMKTNFTTSTKY
jgi:hypothetical protein